MTASDVIVSQIVEINNSLRVMSSIVNDLQISQDSFTYKWQELIGAFVGSFSAFVFGFLTYLITKRRERFVQHKNALNKLEYALNRHLDEISVVKGQIRNIIKLLKEGRLTHVRFASFSLPENFHIELGSLDILNKYLGYDLLVNRFNNDLDSINHIFAKFEDLSINGKATSKESIIYLIDSLEDLFKYFSYFNEETMKLLVIVRLNFYKLKHKNTFTFGVIKTSWEIPITDEEKELEYQKLSEETVSVEKEDSQNKSKHIKK